MIEDHVALLQPQSAQFAALETSDFQTKSNSTNDEGIPMDLITEIPSPETAESTTKRAKTSSDEKNE